MLRVLQRRPVVARLVRGGSASSSSSSVANSTARSSASAAAVLVAATTVGFAAGRLTAPREAPADREVPNGLPRTCCDGEKDLTAAQRDLPRKLGKIVGKQNVLDGTTLDTTTTQYLKGARLGCGSAVCIVTPTKLWQVQQVVQAVVDAGCVVIPQGQNTGLTGGSVPHTTTDSRPTVVLSMKQLDAILPLDNGKRVLCMAGVGLATLQTFLDENFDRESHSVLGSTFLDPSVAAGVAFGSGGTQCRKGPAYTERALYLKVKKNKWNENVVETINTLHVKGIESTDVRGNSPELTAARKVDKWGRLTQSGHQRTMRYTEKDCNLLASDTGYAERLCKNNSACSRYNADVSGPEYARSEGKIILLATVHDTFPRPRATKTFWVGFDSFETALDFRRLCLSNPTDLPVSMEYMDRDAFDVINSSGRILGGVIKQLGTSSPYMKTLWNLKLSVEALPFAWANGIVDKFLYNCNSILPPTLPHSVMKIGTSMDHHVAMTVGEFGDGNMERLLERMNEFAESRGEKAVKVYECKDAEATALTAFRFIAAPAFRTYVIGKGLQGYSVDYALPKNSRGVPGTGEVVPVKRMRYSHFACNVLHEDLAYGDNVNVQDAKHKLKQNIEHLGGRLPAEHGHGTEYTAPAETQRKWKGADPLNVLNPGVGGTSEKYKYEK